MVSIFDCYKSTKIINVVLKLQVSSKRKCLSKFVVSKYVAQEVLIGKIKVLIWLKKTTTSLIEDRRKDL